MLPRRASLVAAASLAAALLLTGCDDDSDSRATSTPASGPSVIAPGAPGEANRTLSAEDAAKQRADDDTPNAADVAYARMMITHHEQALEMSRLAPGQAASGDVKRLAARITAGQTPEIESMRGWLESHGEAASGGHQHTAMPGKATEDQLARLRAARGAAFDDLFLTLMITHHQGAITMATDVKANGNNVQIEEMADDVVAQQTSEIERMRKLQ